jgi:hypothetical protein
MMGLDRVDLPLSDAPWLLAQLDHIQTMPSELSKQAAIAALLAEAEEQEQEQEQAPGSSAGASTGSFYDWLGSPLVSDRPHLLLGQGAATDPGNFFTVAQSASGCTGRHYKPGSSAQATCLASCRARRMSYAGVSWNTSLQMRWEGLEGGVDYTLRIAFPGLKTHDAYGSETEHGQSQAIRILAGDSRLYPNPGPKAAVPVNVTMPSLPVPRNETSTGTLTMSCDAAESPLIDIYATGFAQNCRITEVWLVKSGS